MKIFRESADAADSLQNNHSGGMSINTPRLSINN